MSQVMMTSVPTQWMTPTQQVEQNLQTPQTPIFLNKHHTQQNLMPQNMVCNINAASTAIPRYTYPNLQTAPMSTQSNITPNQHSKKSKGERRTLRDRQASFDADAGTIWMNNCDY